MTSKPPLSVYCLPVSGTAFTRQLAFLIMLSKASKLIGGPKSLKPDVALGSSGGNISAYIAYAADWDHNNINEIINLFDSETFLTSWEHYLLPNWVYFLIAKSLFSAGYGFERIFRMWFGGRSAKEGVEIWTGTVDKDKHVHQLFTNKPKGHTVLTPRTVCGGSSGPLLAESAEIVYMDGDIKAISDITRASASIPFLVNPVCFQGRNYSDGGGIYASPFSVFSSNLMTLSDTRTLRLIFFSSSNVDCIPESSISFSAELKDLINGIINQELRIFVNVLQHVGATNITKYTKVNPDILASLIKDLDASGNHYGIIIFPECETVELETDSVNFFKKIKPEEIKLDIEKTVNSTSVYVYRQT